MTTRESIGLTLAFNINILKEKYSFLGRDERGIIINYQLSTVNYQLYRRLFA